MKKFAHCIAQFATIITVICCIGCANIDDILNDINKPSNGDSDDGDNQLIIADMPIAGIEVLFATSDPVQVTVEVNGWLPDSCTAHHETHQAQEGNTITIQITTTRPRDFACATVVTEYQENVSIGTLPAGDYTVIVNGVEQQFRVD